MTIQLKYNQIGISLNLGRSSDYEVMN